MSNQRHITPEGRGLGWNPQRPDHRDRAFLPSQGPLDVAQTEVALDMEGIPVLNQGQQGCHDEATEVLTDSGWRRWSEYDDRALLGTINPTTGALEYQAPSALQRYRHEGKMHVVDHSRLSFAVTPDHRMWVRKWSERDRTLGEDFEFVTADHLGWYTGLQAAPTGYAGAALEKIGVGARSYAGDDFLALIALIASDGWVGGTENNKNKLSFCCFRSDRRDMVAALAQRLGLHELPSRHGVWQWSDPALADWIRGNLYVGDQLRSPFKRVPTLVQAASQRQISMFLSFFGDQHVDVGRNRQFFTSSAQMADDLQLLILKTGARAAIGEREPRSATMADGREIAAENCTADITVTEAMTEHLSIERKRQVRLEDYSGDVFCATVPNGLLVTRRDRDVLISGNSCTGHGTANGVMYDQKAQKEKIVVPARAMIYYDARLLEGTEGSDSGAQVRDAVGGVVKYGVVPDSEFPYNDQVFNVAPSEQDYTDGKKQEALVYEAVQYPHLDQAIASGFPIVMGFTVYASFESEECIRTGIAPIPKPGEQVLGGHCVLLTGFNSRYKESGNDKIPPRHKRIRNSWGENVGDHGDFFLPEWYWQTGNCSDFWVIRRIGQGS